MITAVIRAVSLVISILLSCLYWSMTSCIQRSRLRMCTCESYKVFRHPAWQPSVDTDTASAGPVSDKGAVLLHQAKRCPNCFKRFEACVVMCELRVHMAERGVLCPGSRRHNPTSISCTWMIRCVYIEQAKGTSSCNRGRSRRLSFDSSKKRVLISLWPSRIFSCCSYLLVFRHRT